MPTAAKLVGALAFFAVGWLAALQVLTTFPDETPARFFPLTIAMIGLWQGWTVAGDKAGEGWRMSFGAGIRTSVQMAFLGLLLFALRTMFIRSADLRYDGPGEAATDAITLFIEYTVQMAVPQVSTVLIVGGILGGILCEKAARRWY